MVWNLTNGNRVGEWVANRIQGSYFADQSQAIGLEKDGEIVAGVIYENWNRRSIMVHIAIEARITPAFLAAIFDYPYNVCGIEKMIAPVDEDNVKCRRMVESMGFEKEAVIKNACLGGDILLYTQERVKCRYLGKRYGQKITATSSDS